MECHMKSRVKAMVEELAREHQRELAAAGTLVDLEELTCHIGDEFARQLCESELVNRARQAADAEQCECPECGLRCPRGKPEPVVLHGLRGEVGFNHPRGPPRSCFAQLGKVAGHGIFMGNCAGFSGFSKESSCNRPTITPQTGILRSHVLRSTTNRPNYAEYGRENVRGSTA